MAMKDLFESAKSKAQEKDKQLSDTLQNSDTTSAADDTEEISGLFTSAKAKARMKDTSFGVESKGVDVTRSANTKAAGLPSLRAVDRSTDVKTQAPKQESLLETIGRYMSGSTDTTLALSPSNSNPETQKAGEYIGGRAISGVVGAARGAINEVGYLGQSAAQGAYAAAAAQNKMNDYAKSAVAGEPITSNVTKNMDASAKKLADEPLKTSVDWGKNFTKSLSEYGYDNDKGMQVLGGVAESIGFMVPSIVSNFIMPGSGLYVMATGAAGNATDEAVANGASNGAALAYGVAVGITEAATEKIFDGLGGIFGKGFTDEWLEAAIKKIAKNPSTQKAMLMFADVLGEGFEEWIAEYAEAYENKLLINQDNRDFKTLSGDALYAAALGSLTSVVMQSVSVGSLSAKDAGEMAADDTLATVSGQASGGTIQPAEGKNAEMPQNIPEILPVQNVQPASGVEAPSAPIAPQNATQSVAQPTIEPAEMPAVVNGAIEEAAATLGDKGAKAFRTVMSGNENEVLNIFPEFAKLYNLGKQSDLTENVTGSALDSRLPETPHLNLAQRYAAYVSGQNDANPVENTGLKPAENENTIKVDEASASTETQNTLPGKTQDNETIAKKVISMPAKSGGSGMTLGTIINGEHFIGNGYIMVKTSEQYFNSVNAEIRNGKAIADFISSSTEPLTMQPAIADVGGVDAYIFNVGGKIEQIGVQRKFMDMFKGYKFFYNPNSATGAVRITDNKGDNVGLIMPIKLSQKVNTSSVATQPEVKPAAAPENKPKPDIEEEPNSKANVDDSQALANVLIKKIGKGVPFNSAVLFDAADAAFGGTMAQGKYTPKDAYDALELAVNQYLISYAKDFNGNVKTAVNAVKSLQQLLDIIPTQTKRTDEQMSFQQFSTPPNIAFLTAWAANITENDAVLEPSAGIGGLAVFPKAWGAKVYVNELSERRLSVLENMGFDEVYNVNAEQLNNLLPDDVKPSVVLMNPPFSSTAGRTSTNKTSNAIRHVEQALLRLEDNGRLVAILGKGMANDSPSFKGWWNELRKKYDIRANLSIDGSNYKKYGTTFGNQIVVIDKTGPQKGETITGDYTDLTEIPKVLEGIRNDRATIKENTSIVSGRSVSGTDTPKPAAVSGRGSLERPNGITPGNGRSGTVSIHNGRGTGQRTGDNVPVSDNGSGENGKPVGSIGGEISGSVRVEPESDGINQSGAKPAVQGLTERPRSKVSKSDDGIYSEYVPAELPLKGAKKHPAPLVESAAMAAVPTPKAEYVPKLPRELITTGAISDAQLENIIYAGQAHEQVLPDGSRKGYFIGDGTGVGKGRQISGIILDNYLRGRKKALWVSNNAPLLDDARRDWADIGGNKDLVFSQSKTKLDGKIADSEGILFTTYDTLKTEKAQNSRLKQIIDWAGKDFDGVIAFDEAHNMSNLLGKKGSRGNTKPSAKAMAGLELQDALPNARIVYVSATAATDVRELAFAKRLGLWGRGTQFMNVEDFVSKISSGGLAAMELVARDMKSMGLYLARSISYDGVTYDTLQHDLTTMQTQIYNTMCQAWQVTLNNIDSALNVTGAINNANARSSALSAYYGAMQRFYNQVLTSMSMPSVVKDIKKELAKGHSCILQIVNTNQAESDRQIAKAKETGAALEELDLTPKGTLLGYLENSFPIYAYEEVEDDEGNRHAELVVDKDGNPVIDKEAVAMRDELIARVNEMSVPEGPLEILFADFGTDQVAEITGRTRRVVPKMDANGETKLAEESRTSNHVAADVQAFQDGKKHILVFSDAGGTGKSYHADKRAKNQEQRVHYLLQAGWSASKATQGFGRSHRSNQVTIPQFKLVTTNIMGQKRFISTIARRLDQLGALTKGQRETGSGMFGAKDNLESDLAKDSLRNFYDNLGHNRVEGVDGMEILKKLGLDRKFVDEYGSFKLNEDVARDMNTFLNRILALEVDEQNIVFGEFNRIFETNFEKAMESGTLDLGLENVKADRIEILDDKVIRTDENTGATTNYVQAKTYKKPTLLTTIAALENFRNDFRGIYRTEKGDIRAVYRIADKTDAYGRVSKMYRMQSAVTSKSAVWSDEKLKKSAELIDRAKWGTEWDTEVAKAPEFIDSTVHMLTGTLLPIWNRLPNEGSTRVMRIIADDGSQYLGRVIPPSQIDDVLKSMGVGGRTKETYSPAELAKRILQDGAKVVLTENRIIISRRRVSGEYRMEITGNNLWYVAQQYKGIITETINYERRYFIPTGETGESILASIIKDNPVANVSTESSEDTDSLRSVGYSIDGKTATWTPERINRLFIDYASSLPNYSKAYATYISPDDFLSLTTRNVSNIEAEAKPLNLDELRKETQMIHLTYNPDEPGEVWGHEGRHRMVALRDAGIKKVAIAVEFRGESGKQNRQPIDKLTLIGEEFSSGRAPGRVTLTGLVPISKAYRSDIEERFGTNADIQFSKSSNISETSTDKWSAARVGSGDKAPMPLSDIVNKVRYDFGIPITTGHIRGGKTLGEYRKSSQGIRTKIANDLPTVAHELGHHLDNKYSLVAGMDKTLANEIVDGLSSEMKILYPEKKWKTEALAEFVRKYLQNRETAAIDYPKFTEYFTSSMSDADAELVAQLADEVNAYYALDVDTASSAIRLGEETGKDFRTTAEKIKDKSDEIYQAWIDSNRGIKLFDRATGADTYKLASNSAYADAVAGAILTGDLTDINGQRVSDGLIAILKDIDTKNRAEYRDFGEYLVVKHGPERLNEGMRIFADDRKNSTKWMNFRQAELENKYPQFEETSEKLYEFQKSFLQTWGVSTGLVSAESAEQWAERWKHYVPLNRAVGDKGGVGAKSGYANQNSTIKKAHGSGLDIVHPVDNIVNNIVRMVNAGMRNNVMVAITKEAKKNEGMALFLEKVPAPIKVTAYDAKELKDKLSKQILGSSMTGEGATTAFDIVNGIDDILLQYGRGKAFGDVITVLKGGDQEFWKINDPMLLSSVTNMSVKRMPAWLETYGEISRFITSNLTGNNVLWSIFSNFPRDVMTMFTYSKDKNMLHILGGIGSAYANKIKGSNADPLYKEYLAMGGGKTSAYTADRSLARNIRKKVTGDKISWLNPLEWLEFVADAVELGPRYSYYKIMRNKGYTPADAFFESTDITVNFRRGGINGRTLNKVIPFFNAGVQGLDKFARWISAEEAPVGSRATAVRGRAIAFSLASLALAALNFAMNGLSDKDKKNYAQLSNYTKNSYWCIPLGDGKYFTIPKPREIAVMTSFMEACVERFVSGNKHAFDEFYDYVTQQSLPNVVSDIAQGDAYGAIGSLGIIGVGAYMMANRDFLGNPIVSSGLQSLEPKDQYTSRTSKIAKWVGQAFNLSPQMIDFFFQQTLGGWWKAQKALFPVGGENTDYTLGIQNQYIKDNQYSTDLVNWLYDSLDKSQAKKNSNPEDTEAAIAYKWDNLMTTFYSRYYKLAKGEAETTDRRATRQTVLNMITEYRKSEDNGTKTDVQQEVETICNQTGSTENMPAAMQNAIKDDAGTSYTLTDSQYVEYQTEYLTAYYDYVEGALPLCKSISEKDAALKAAKAMAKEDATARALNRLGVTTAAYTESQKAEAAGVAATESVLFDAAIDAANNDGSLKQTEVIAILQSMNISNAERSYLFGTRYESDKNNPFD